MLPVLLTLLLSCTTDTAPGESDLTDAVISDGGDTTATTDGTDEADPSTTPSPAGALRFEGSPPQNILVITWDTTRPDLFSRYTGDGSTPALDGLLADSLVLEDHRSCSNWTYASMICVQTGSRDVLTGFIPSTESEIAMVPESISLVSEDLKERGYQTVLVGDQPFMSPENGMDAGFDFVDVSQGMGAVNVTDSALYQIATSDEDRPWYAHVHYLEPHAPYDPPAEYLTGLDDLRSIPYDLTRSGSYTELQNSWPELDQDMQSRVLDHLQTRYRAGLNFTDAELDRLLTTLDGLGRLEDTLIVFLTDHGEQLFEHGDLEHGKGLYKQENNSIASFYANNLRHSEDWTGPTSHEDVWPTIYSAMGWEAPEIFSGTPVGQRPDDTVLYATHYRGAYSFQSIEQRGVKMVYWWETGEKNLYRLDSDPEEMSDVYDSDDPDVVALWDLLTPEIERILTVYPDTLPVNPSP